MSHYLLIVACSQRKRLDSGLLPAIERYDGGAFRLLRKAQREGYWPKRLDVLVLSAKYGLIDALAPISNYEQRMTCERAYALQSRSAATLRDFLAREPYHEAYIDLGQEYRPAIEGLSELDDILVSFAQGRIGERLAQLKRWLIAHSGER